MARLTFPVGRATPSLCCEVEMADWPRLGRCGACGRAALGFPSGRWEHVGRPCRARSQAAWHIDSVSILRACRFVPAGEPLPVEPDRPHWHETRHDETGFPVELGWCTTDHLPSVREVLAREAEMDVVLMPLNRPIVDLHLPEPSREDLPA